FDVRRSSDKKNKYNIILRKKLVCSREGYKAGKKSDPPETVIGKRPNVVSHLTSPVHGKDCVQNRRCGRYLVTTFEEGHAHCLCNDSYKPFLKVNRKLDVGHQQFITNCAKVNVGSSKSFEIYAEVVGGTENVGATQQDFKNYRREVLAYMHGGDCQMVISKYLDIKADYPDMYFEYEANHNDQLIRIFWSDGVARKHYSAFRDVVSFDATYKTNR
ncbi:PREDICTED: protein FAR1-RELATED SEQUENCE 5-like, partial [Ipomoea nil]|uniref:protein FAR1-RELATED SEQUENCE 5-like n=1 Tax=Ipomoea nil TaxID=35883 RepID=UPI000901ED2C